MGPAHRTGRRCLRLRASVEPRRCQQALLVIGRSLLAIGRCRSRGKSRCWLMNMEMQFI